MVSTTPRTLVNKIVFVNHVDVKTTFLSFSVILPLVIRGLCSSFNIGGEEMQEDWSTFGFLYGTIPPAPTGVIYASVFSIQDDLASIIIIGSIFKLESFIYNCVEKRRYMQPSVLGMINMKHLDNTD